MSTAPQDATLIKGFTNAEIEAEVEAAGQVGSDPADRVFIDAMDRDRAGEPLPEIRFPRKLYVKKSRKNYNGLPDFFLGGGFWIVSAPFAEVLNQSNLGKSSLYPVNLFKRNQKTPFEGEYFILNFGETMTAFEPDQTPNVKVYGGVKSRPPGRWTIPFGSEVAIKKAALEGPDLWLDPSVPSTFFLSDDLVQALKKAKLTRELSLKRCRIV